MRLPLWCVRNFFCAVKRYVHIILRTYFFCTEYFLIKKRFSRARSHPYESIDIFICCLLWVLFCFVAECAQAHVNEENWKEYCAAYIMMRSASKNISKEQKKNERISCVCTYIYEEFEHALRYISIHGERMTNSFKKKNARTRVFNITRD